MSLTLVIPGTPVAKGRPKFVRATGRTYTPAKTKAAENRVYLAWLQAGQPTLPDGPLWLDVTIVLNRPQSHYKTDGSLSLAGRRSERPTKKPDADNAIKLVADALQGFAFRDDAQLVTLHCEKRWANPGEDEHTRIVAGEVPVTRLVAVRRAA